MATVTLIHRGNATLLLPKYQTACQTVSITSSGEAPIQVAQYVSVNLGAFEQGSLMYYEDPVPVVDYGRHCGPFGSVF